MTLESIPVELGDALIQRWESSGCGDYVGRLEMEFDGALDEALLRRAMDVLLANEPILRTRLVLGKTAEWQVVEGDPVRNPVNITTLESEYEALRDRPLASGLQGEVSVLRQPSGDRLALCVAHQVSDGGSTTLLGERLASIYTKLAAGESVSTTAMPREERGLKAVMASLTAKDQWKLAWKSTKLVMHLMVARVFRLQGDIAPPDEGMTRTLRRIEPDRVASIVAYGRARGATMNDLFVAAYFRATAAVGKWDGSKPLMMPMTIDLRRWYIDDTERPRVTNLSAVEVLSLGRQLGSNFDETLAKVVVQTNRLKSNYPGMALIGMLRMNKPRQLATTKPGLGRSKRLWQRPGIPPAFTNMGPINKANFNFGGMYPKWAYMMPSSLKWPALVVGLSGYGGALTLSARTSSSATPTVTAIMDTILAELPG